ncbi:hypothetical protein J7F03_02775 [Streptomyces sp. ISL-43]|uniref:hypothetical protein n=1 Tax=Streptomyces sp. ISL-43 TaxID=2819183 RepID=UPI001BE70252|nr:hypothetical protein [Streptomyces sp. ISL-43]MBT2446028.1 hypothetical protein [Streptomyces sp. ISL-43]
MNDTVTLAAGWISTGWGMGADIKKLIFIILIPCLCGLFVVAVGWKTKAPGPTIVACILGAVVWGLSASMGTLQGKVTEDITTYNGTTISGDQ